VAFPQLGGEGGDVVTVVVVVLEGQPAVDAHDGGAEASHLLADVVDVVLAGDAVPGRLEQRGDRVARRRPATGTEVQRARRVGGHELDVDVLAAVGRTAPERGPLGEDAPQEGGVRHVGQPEVHEPRPGDLDRLDLGERGEPLREHLRELAGRSPGRPCRAERDGRGPVPVVGVLRPLQRRVLRRQAQTGEGVTDRRREQRDGRVEGCEVGQGARSRWVAAA